MGSLGAWGLGSVVEEAEGQARVQRIGSLLLVIPEIKCLDV